MEDLGEGLDAGGEAGAGAGEIAGSLEGEDAAIADGGNEFPAGGEGRAQIFVAGLPGVVAAGRDEENLGRGDDHLLVGDAGGGLARMAEDVLPAGEGDHLRNPMAAGEERIEPFEQGDSGTRPGVRDFFRDAPEALVERGNQGLCAIAAACGFANKQNIPPHVGNVARIEGNYLRLAREAREHRSEVVGRSGTDDAKVLGNDQVRRQLFERGSVHGIEALAARDVFADDAIYLGRRQVMWNARMDDAAARGRLRREIAFVADAKDFFVKAQREENLRGGRQEGDDAHGATVARKGTGLKTGHYGELSGQPGLRFLVAGFEAARGAGTS